MANKNQDYFFIFDLRTDEGKKPSWTVRPRLSNPDSRDYKGAVAPADNLYFICLGSDITITFENTSAGTKSSVSVDDYLDGGEVAHLAAPYMKTQLKAEISVEYDGGEDDADDLPMDDFPFTVIVDVE